MKHARRVEQTAYGLRFECAHADLDLIETGMAQSMQALGISPALVGTTLDRRNGTLLYSLNSAEDDSSTLDLTDRPELGIIDEAVG